MFGNSNQFASSKPVKVISAQPFEEIFSGFSFDAELNLEAVEEINHRTTKQALIAIRSGDDDLVESLNVISRICSHAMVTHQNVIFSTGY